MTGRKYQPTVPEAHGSAMGSILRQVALGMADGQLEQADRWLAAADGRGRRPRPTTTEPPIVIALLHMRSARGWLASAAEHT